jgi:hypothetical protein
VYDGTDKRRDVTCSVYSCLCRLRWIPGESLSDGAFLFECILLGIENSNGWNVSQHEHNQLAKEDAFLLLM